MLKRIELENFLSYGKQNISLDGESAIAIVGENGSGKSSVLEGINFALYGRGRYKTINELVRLGSTSMRTAVDMSGNFAGGGKLVRVERSFGKKGGSLQVFVDGELKAKGGADPKNNQAQEYIDTLLGVDSQTFQMTAFFGMGGGDSLLKVLPSERLETLQKLAGAELCNKINKKASDEVKAYKSKIEAEKRALEVLTENVVDNEALVQDIEEKQLWLNSVTPKIDKMQERVAKLQDKLEASAVLRGELDALQKAATSTDRELITIQSRLKKAQATLKEIRENGEDYKKTAEQKLEGDLAFMEKELDAANNALGEYHTLIALKSSGGSLGGDTCPLCDNKIGKDKLALLKGEAENLKKKSNALRIERDELQDNIREYRRRKAQIDSAKEALVAARKSYKAAVERVEADELVEHDTRNKIQEQQIRISKITEQLKADRALESELTSLEYDLENKIKERTEAERDIHHAEEVLEDVKSTGKRIKKLESTIKELEGKQKAYSLVAEGFSRYEIPFRMLKSLRVDIEKRASQIFREFTDGNIIIRDVQGQRPGVDFVLADAMGERVYEGLSEGEKIMMYLAIRIAITQRENKLRDSKIDFLILDEVVGHLSPGKRDALMVVINKILKKYFPQVFMVSHVPLREIFTRTLTVSRSSGVSEVRG